VNSLTSSETDLPFEYYTMPFCKPPEGVKKASSANLGTVLMGVRLENSPYNFSMWVGTNTVPRSLKPV
jgi:transmembrane 9 superfamily protein 2/4